MHLIALHDSAVSGNPLGVSGNYDRLPFAPYFIFKDLITIVIIILISTSLILYTARSTKGIIRLSSVERALITMPDDIKDVLIGILLGDAHIVRRSSTSNSRLVYAQTAVAHKEYFDFVYSLFIPFCAKDYTPQLRIVRDNRTNKTYSAISFTTMQLPCFNVFKEIFYVSNVKRVPDNIYELLTLKGLAF